jgi:hypothetical protein
MIKVMSIFGTRPEAIKMAPVVKEFQKFRESFKSLVCVTAQHRQMLDQVLNLFEIKPDYDLDIMKPRQDLFDVTCNVIQGLINSGKIHIVEPDLDILVRSALNSGNLKATLVPQEADTFILAVPTPLKADDGTKEKIPDLSYVEAATRAIAPFLREDNLIILESTSPVGTTERIRDIMAELRPDLFPSAVKKGNKSKLYITHCPERVRPVISSENSWITTGLSGASIGYRRKKLEIYTRPFVTATSS